MGRSCKSVEGKCGKVRPVRQHVLESVRCMRANERRVQHVQVHNRSCEHAARISKRAMHAGMKRNCTHVSAHCMQHASRSCTTSFLFGPSTHTMIREACSARGVLRATTLAQRPSRLPEVRWTDFSGAPASRSDTRRRSSTLPEVRCSDVSGPPASRSYTRWPQLHLARSPLQRERWCVEAVC